MEPRTAMEAHNRSVEGLHVDQGSQIFGDHFDEKQDPDPQQSLSRIRIRIQVKKGTRIHIKMIRIRIQVDG